MLLLLWGYIRLEDEVADRLVLFDVDVRLALLVFVEGRPVRPMPLFGRLCFLSASIGPRREREAHPEDRDVICEVESWGARSKVAIC